MADDAADEDRRHPERLVGVGPDGPRAGDSTADPVGESAFITDEGGRESTVWRYRFDPHGDGRTRVTESYEVRWIPVWARLLDVPTSRHKELLRGMRTTLERLRERPPRPTAARHRHGPSPSPKTKRCPDQAPGLTRCRSRKTRRKGLGAGQGVT